MVVPVKRRINNLPHLLARHNEGPTYIPIFYKPFAIRKLQFLCQIQRSHPRRVWYLEHRLSGYKVNLKISNRYDNIDGYICFLQDSPDLVRKGITHGHATSIDADAVQDRIGSRKVHVFKNIRSKNGSWGQLAPGHS